MLTVGELFQRFAGSCPASERTQRFRLWGWQRLTGYAGWERTAELDSRVRAFDGLFRFRSIAAEQDWSSKSINKAHRVGRQVAAFGCDGGLLHHNWLAQIKYLRNEDRHLRRALSLDEVSALLRASPAIYRRMWLAYILTGLRPSELVELTWDRVDLNAGLILLRAGDTKTRQQRFAILGTRLVTMLAEQAGSGGAQPGSPVFPNAEGAFFRNNLIRALRKCLRYAGIAVETPEGIVDLHALRVTFGTLLMTELGTPLGVAKALIGHGKQAMTGVLLLDKYCKPRLDQEREWAQRLEDLILG